MASHSIRSYAPFAVVAAVGVLTIGSGILFYRSKQLPVATVPGKMPAAKTATHIRGPVDAPITVEEFGDFECPPCGRLAGPISSLEREFSPRLRVIFRNFPLATHLHARQAACAAEAAGLQGRFWEMHDLLYKEQISWSKAADPRVLFSAYAGTLGLDLGRFERDFTGSEVAERIAADQARANSLGVNTTPSLFINGQRLAPAALRSDGLRAQVDAVIKTLPSG